MCLLSGSQTAMPELTVHSGGLGLRTGTDDLEIPVYQPIHHIPIGAKTRNRLSAGNLIWRQDRYHSTMREHIQTARPHSPTLRHQVRSIECIMQGWSPRQGVGRRRARLLTYYHISGHRKLLPSAVLGCTRRCATVGQHGFGLCEASSEALRTRRDPQYHCGANSRGRCHDLPAGRT